jgi:hypothetical protein
MMRRNDNQIAILRPGRAPVVVATITDDERIAAATTRGYSRAVAGAVLTGNLTLHCALELGRYARLIAWPNTAEAREQGLIK